MKRFALIATIALVVLAMSAGTAFASVCAGPRCDAFTRCESGVMPEHMGMSAPQSAAIQARCNMGVQERASDLTALQSGSEKPSLAVAASAPAPVPATARSSASAFVSADARGAPHLSAVLRL